MYRVGLDLPVRHPRDPRPVRRRAAARAALRPVRVPRDHRGARRARPGVRGRRPRPRRRPLAGDPARHADPRAGDLVGARDRLRRVGERLRRRRDARLQVELHARDLPALRGDQQLPAELPDRGGDGLAARRLGRRCRSCCRPGRCAAAATRSSRAARGRSCGASSRRRGRAARGRRASPASSSSRSASRASAPSAARCSATSAARSALTFVNYTPGLPQRRAARPARALARVRRDRRLVHRRRRLRRRAPAHAAADARRRGCSTSCCSRRSRCRASSSPPATSSPTTCRSSRGSGSTSTRRRRCCSSPTPPRACRRTRACSSAPVSQLQASLHDAARAHGAGALRAWLRGRAAADLASRS